MSDDNDEITHLLSREGEILRLLRPVNIMKSTPEKWLNELERQMKHAVKLNLYLSYLSFDEMSLQKWSESWIG